LRQLWITDKRVFSGWFLGHVQNFS